MTERDIYQGAFIFNGIHSEDYGVWIKGPGTYNAPERQYTTVEVPGRNGVLTLDDGAFKEIEHTYPAFIIEDFDANITGLRNSLMASPGYHRLEDGYHPDEFYMARYMDGLESNVFPLGVAGEFKLKCVREPRRFLKTGDIAQTIANGGKIENPTLFDAKPLIRVTGYGEMYVGSYRITITNLFPYVDIDCEMMDCYHGIDIANPVVTFQGNDFPVLPPGRTGVTYSGHITKVEITPHWWRL